MTNPVQKILDLTSQEIASLGEGERINLLMALRQAEEELSIGLRGWIKAGREGTDKFTLRELQGALRAVRSAKASLGALEEAAASSLSKSRESAGLLASQHIKFQYESLSALKTGEMQFLNINTAAILSKSDQLLITRHSKHAKKYSKDVTAWIRRQLSTGVVRNETFDQMTSRVLKLAGPTPVNVFVSKTEDLAATMARALLRAPRSWASRLVRTEVMNAYNTYHENTIISLAEGDPGFMKRWDSSLDRRGCVTCRELDGEAVRPKSTFSSGVHHPPQHPYCRCTIVPWRKEWKHDSVQSEGTEGINPPDPKPTTW